MPAHETLSPSLVADLLLVLPRVEPLGSVSVEATIDGKAAPLEDALARAAQRVHDSRAPALVGMNHLTIEAAREAIAFAERLGARLLPEPVNSQPPSRIVHTATLGHVQACDLVIWVGSDSDVGRSHPVARAISDRARSSTTLIRVADDLGTILDIRRRVAADPSAEPFGDHGRIAAVLGPSSDPRVIDQWHQLAAHVQEHARLCVFALPLPSAANLRGVSEVITWQTGVWPGRGGVDFGDGCPRACADRRVLEHAGALDLVMRAGAGSLDIGDTVSFRTPGLAAGLGARVMRCDGIVLWLCDDPSTAPPDPTVDLFKRLGAACGTVS